MTSLWKENIFTGKKIMLFITWFYTFRHLNAMSVTMTSFSSEVVYFNSRCEIILEAKFWLLSVISHPCGMFIECMISILAPVLKWFCFSLAWPSYMLFIFLILCRYGKSTCQTTSFARPSSPFLHPQGLYRSGGEQNIFFFISVSTSMKENIKIQ